MPKRAPTRINQIAADLESITLPIGEFVTLPGNPRRGDVEAIKGSLLRFGQRFPIAYRLEHDPDTGEQHKVVYAGNHRLLAARELGWTVIAAADMADLSHEEAEAFALADNRTGDLGGYDSEALANLLSKVNTYDPSLVAAAGYSPEDLVELLDPGTWGEWGEGGGVGTGDGGGDEASDVDRDLLGVLDVSIAEPTHQPETGDVYRLGPHTLIVASVMHQHRLWAPYLTEESLFTPYPSPFVPAIAVVPDGKHLVLVQPDKYLAGHVLDKWVSVHGGGPVPKVAA